MKKPLFLIVGLTLLLFFASSNVDSKHGNRVGDMAENLTISNADTAVSLQTMKGKYVLLSFWSSADARSRIANIECDAVARNFGDKLALVAVNYDRDELVFNEIISGDKLRKDTQFYDRDGENSSIFEDYDLGRGFKTYLIDPAGKIVAENPGAAKLASILRQ